MSILSNPKEFGEVLTTTAENLAHDIKSVFEKITIVHQKMEKEFGVNIELNEHHDREDNSSS